MTVPRPRPVDRKPAVVSGSVAVTAALTAAALVANTPTGRGLVGVAAAGLFAVLLGSGFRTVGRYRRALVVAPGSVLLVVAPALGLVAPLAPPERALLLASLLGPVLVGFAVVPLRVAWSRQFAALGVGSLVVTALARRLVSGVPELRLFAALSLALLAWDASVASIAFGEQLGRGVRTAAVELRRLAATLVVAVAGVVAALSLAVLPTVRLSLPALGTLLLGVLVLLGWLST